MQTTIVNTVSMIIIFNPTLLSATQSLQARTSQNKNPRAKATKRKRKKGKGKR